MLLSFKKPKKARSTKEHNDNHMSDSGVAGTYVSNMSEDDKKRFKAKYIKGDDERVEIRVERGVNILIKVFKKAKKTPRGRDFNWRDAQNDHGEFQMSMNGKLDISMDEWVEIMDAVYEASCFLSGDFTLEEFN